MTNLKNKFFIDIFKTIIVPIISGIFFIIWIYYLFQYPIEVFPISFLIFIPIYVISGSVFGGIFITFAVAAALFTIAITSNKFLLIYEILWIILVFIFIEKHRKQVIFSKNKLDIEHEILDRDISIIQSSIINNEKKSIGLNKRIKNFQAFGQIIQTLEVSLSEEELIKKVEEMAKKFIEKGNWKIKKYPNKDIFCKYVKENKSSLLIQDTSKNTYFNKENFKSATSIVVVPIEIEGKFWGTINGISNIKNESFNDSDLRFIYILSNICSIAMYNALLFSKLSELAITDTLTGLYTRNYFIERAKDEIQHATTNKSSLTISILDIDNFKNINDTYGHQSGDTVLRKLSDMLIGRFRETDIVCRYGGEEFIILMPHTNKKEAIKILEDLRKKIANEKIFLPIESYHPIYISITISIGIKELQKEKNIDELISKADLALYDAKKTGKNKICLYEEN